jgi:hypothetical protein
VLQCMVGASVEAISLAQGAFNAGRYHPSLDVRSASAEAMKIGVSFQSASSANGGGAFGPPADALCMHENPPGGA